LRLRLPRRRRLHRPPPNVQLLLRRHPLAALSKERPRGVSMPPRSRRVPLLACPAVQYSRNQLASVPLAFRQCGTKRASFIRRLPFQLATRAGDAPFKTLRHLRLDGSGTIACNGRIAKQNTANRNDFPPSRPVPLLVWRACAFGAGLRAFGPG